MIIESILFIAFFFILIINCNWSTWWSSPAALAVWSVTSVVFRILQS
ncbi:hypothetical protein M088_5849 [Bacteroides ovatus str. 3725 D1 iv]|nr:hypothetical protein M088_5849 [Bacteroides ovatus str. 3725 D1 iv]